MRFSEKDNGNFVFVLRISWAFILHDRLRFGYMRTKKILNLKRYIFGTANNCITNLSLYKDNYLIKR